MSSHPATSGTAAVATRVFTSSDQDTFAALSGDTNPMHMDPLSARRTQAGEPVVHGIHALLWLLDALAAAGHPLQTTRHIKVQFSKFMYLGRSMAVHIRQATAESIRAVILADGVLAMTVTLRFGQRANQPMPEWETPIANTDRPATLQLEHMSAQSGWLSPPVGANIFATAFVHAAAQLDPRRLSGLAQISRLIGMVCPGLYSIFASLDVHLGAVVGDPEGIGFHTSNVDTDFRLIELVVQGDGLAGTVTAFARHAPVEAPKLASIAVQLDPAEFAGTTSLVVGGSRGLGAITAKIIAAGGGRVIVTYLRGRDDAQKLRDEINAVHGDGACEIRQFDATQPVEAQLAPLAGVVSHLYYFATPQIFVQKSEQFSASVCQGFTRVYVEAFYDTCRALHCDKLAVFYPSSVAVQERPRGMIEYSMAKAAGEMLCADMAEHMPGLRILTHRLPRILTDQTATIAHADSADPVEVMLPLVRATHAL